MLSNAMDEIVGRAIRDAEFRIRFIKAPVETARASGFELTAEEERELSTADLGEMEAFLTRLDAHEVPTVWCSNCACYEREYDGTRCPTPPPV